MSDAAPENLKLTDDDLDGLSGGLYWNGNDWTETQFPNGVPAGVTTSASGKFTSYPGNTRSQGFSPFRVVTTATSRNVMINRGQGEEIFSSTPL